MDFDKDKGPTDEQTAMGGDWLEVTFKTREGKPKKEKIFVTQIDCERIDDGSFFEAKENEGRLIEFYCEQEAGWGKTLTVKSQADVLELGRQLNFFTIKLWAKRKKEDLLFFSTLISQAEKAILNLRAPLERIWQSLLSKVGGSSTKSTAGK